MFYSYTSSSTYSGFCACLQGLNVEWTEISQCLDPDRSQSAAVPHRFLESIHVYTMANILRRPVIIMTDPTMRTFSGMSLQDNDMGGIYLPLEWSWRDTNRTPILIGYFNSHFCPLLFGDPPNQAVSGVFQKKHLAPLVNGRFEQLPVRFLLEGEEPEVGELLRKYLKVKETVMQVNGSVQNILCAELEISNLPDELNLVHDYLQDCLRRYQQEKALASAQQMQYQAGFSALRQEHLQQSAHPMLSQAPGSPQHVNVMSEQLPRMQTNEYGLGDPVLQNMNAFGQNSVHIPPPSFTPRLSSAQQNISLNPSQDQKCVVPTCKYFGDPDLAMMCSNCFRNYSIKESRKMAANRALRPLPTAPLASMHAEEEPLQMSMMSERCKEGCGFRCSTKTFPYCHECADKCRRKAQEKAAATASGSAVAPLVSTGSLNAVSPALYTPVPQEGLGAVLSPQPLDLNTAQGTSSASPLPAASAGSGMPQEHQAESKAAPSLPAGETSAQAMSPTQALAAASLNVPLTPPDETNDQLLFGSGQSSPVTPSQRGGVVSPTEPEPQSSPASPSQVAASVEPFTAQPQPPVSGQNSQRLLFSLPNTEEEEEQQPEVSRVQEQNMLSAAARLPENQLASVITGGAEAQLTRSCSNPNCSGDMMHKDLCGKCYMGQGMNIAAPGDPTVQKVKMMSTASTSSSAPASIGQTSKPKSSVLYTKEMGAFFPPENKSRAASLTHLPSNVPLTNSKVRNWLDDNSKATASKGRKEAMMPSGPRSQPLGLPEKQESEVLGGTDLLVSGEACFSSTSRCIGQGCGNAVLQDGKLCQQCQDILGRARQGQGSRSSVQGELTSQLQCIVCTYKRSLLRLL